MMPRRTRFLFLLLFIAGSALPLSAQSVSDLDKTSRQFSGTRSSGSSYSSGSGGDIGTALDGILFFTRAFVYLGEGIVLFAREERRLWQRNANENHLFAAEGTFQAGYGLTDFTRLEGQIRIHLGAVTLDYRQNLLNDRRTEFVTHEFMGWTNFLNRPKFQLRAGLGNLYFQNSRQSYFLYGVAGEFSPSEKIRIELSANRSPLIGNSGLRPRDEVQFRCYYDFWKKSHVRASVFGGVSSQRYFQDLTFTTLNGGLRFLVSFHPFEKGIPSR